MYDKVNVAVRNFSFASAFPVIVSAGLPGGGSLKIDGTAGPINSTDTSLTPVQAKVTLKKLDLSQSAIVDPELGITGSADFDGTLSSDGHIAKASGTLKATSLKLVPKGSPAGVPVQVVFAVEHDLKNESGKLAQGDVAIGKALAKLTGTYDMHGETTSIHTKLNGQAMPVDDLEAMLPGARRGSSHRFAAQGRNAFGRNRLGGSAQQAGLHRLGEDEQHGARRFQPWIQALGHLRPLRASRAAMTPRSRT